MRPTIGVKVGSSVPVELPAADGVDIVTLGSGTTAASAIGVTAGAGLRTTTVGVGVSDSVEVEVGVAVAANITISGVLEGDGPADAQATSEKQAKPQAINQANKTSLSLANLKFNIAQSQGDRTGTALR